MQKKLFTTKTLVLAGFCIALSTVLSYVKLFEMPQGGSITLASMLPLILFSFIFGPVPGMIAGLAHGLLQVALGGYVIHPAQMFLDYPLAFACLGLAGIIPQAIKNLSLRFSLGVFLAIFFRGIMSVLSGVIFFSEYAGEMNPWLYSIVYNYSFLGVECLITIVVGLIIIATPIYGMLKRDVANA